MKSDLDARQQHASARRKSVVACSSALALIASSAVAGTFETENGISVDYGLTANYDVGLRMGSPSKKLIDGGIDPATGLARAANMDDGNRNFKRHALVNNRASLLGELEVKGRNLGFVTRASVFYDDAYRGGNDNNSPASINKNGQHDRFTSAVRHKNGSRSRILDAYLYGNWSLGEQTALNLRAGRHIVAWGESMFFSGIAAAMSPVDATKFVLPGVELKDALLPVGQLSGQLELNDRFSLIGYAQFESKPLEMDGPGSYMSYVDMVGPGSQFMHLFANPLAGMPGADATVRAVRGRDIKARSGGQWGVGGRYRVTAATELGFYHLKYHDKSPNLVFTMGDPVLAPGMTLGALSGAPGAPLAPVSYQFKYFEDIKLTGVSFSTDVLDANVAGEISYKRNVPVLVDVMGSPTAVRGDVAQVQVSWIRGFHPGPMWDVLNFIGEIGYQRVMKVSSVDIPMVGKFDDLSNSKNSFAYQLGLEPQYNAVFPGWDMSVPISYAHLVTGRPAVAGSFGSLVGGGDRRLSVGVNFKYLSNFTISAAYNAFLGKADPVNRPLADRDYLAFNVKYSF